MLHLEDFSDAGVHLRVRVGLLRFTTPDGMPWIKSENPSDLKEVVTSLLPDAEMWKTDDERAPEGQIDDALRWAAEGSVRRNGVRREPEHLVVIAGSLYLIADLYRFMKKVGEA